MNLSSVAKWNPKNGRCAVAAYLSKYSENFQFFSLQFRVHTDNFWNYFFFVDFVSLFLTKFLLLLPFSKKTSGAFKFSKHYFGFQYLLSLVLPMHQTRGDKDLIVVKPSFGQVHFWTHIHEQ